MPDLFAMSAYIIYSVIVTVLVIDNIRIRLRHRKMIASSMQLVLDKATLLQKLADKEDSQSLEKSDGFLRFVSESRDWAFEYIEDVQKAITELRDAVDSGEEYEEQYQKLLSYLP